MAKIKLGEIEKRLMSKRNGAHQEVPWEEFISKYLDYCRANQAKETVVRNEVVFKNFNKAIPIRLLSDLAPQLLEEFKLIRKNDGIQASTINREISAIKTAMKKAAEWNYATVNVWGVRKVPEVKKRPVFYTQEEIGKLIEVADPFWRVVIYLGFYAGLRKGEMLALEWADIDFERHQVRITPKADWRPKDYDAREIETHPVLEEYLANWKKLAQPNGKVVPWDRQSNHLSMGFTALRKKAGLDKGSLHSLRHSFASHMAMAGVDLYRIGKMMGHSSVVTTQIYAHLLPSSLRDAILALPNIRSGSAPAA
ncbi:MAG: site-specific integrase [Elusimicrobia bacterium]|nr:site-specific integrase [Elusimicrobiota bacterium]